MDELQQSTSPEPIPSESITHELTPPDATSPEPIVSESASPEPAPPAPPAKETSARPVKQRRVGTFSLGLTLILLGVSLSLCLLFGSEAQKILSLAPIVLAFLGIEVLYYAIRYKAEKLRYDKLSVLLILFITVIALIVPPLGRSFHYYREKDAAKHEVYTAARIALDNSGYAGNVYAWEHRSYGDEILVALFEGTLPEDWQAEIHFELYDIGTDIPTQEEVVRAIESVLEKMSFDRVAEVEFVVWGIPDGEEYQTALYQANFAGDLETVDRNRIKQNIYSIYAME